MKCNYCIQVLKRSGSLPDITWKVVFERSFNYLNDPITNPTLEFVLSAFKLLYPDRDEFKITLTVL